MKTLPVLIMGTLGALLLSSCVSSPRKAVQAQVGESIVCIGEEPAALAWLPLRGRPVRVRSSYGSSGSALEYLPGRDYVVDYEAGTLRRSPGSRLPDFSTNSLHGKQSFDHSRFPGYGNSGYFAFVDYSFKSSVPWPVQAAQTEFLKKTQAKLAEGGALQIVAYGDSITFGGEATKPELIFWNRWAEDLRRRHPTARISVTNGATGGDSTTQGLARLQAKVIDEHPDLVLIGFGMNDHNVAGYGVDLPQFEQNLKLMIGRIRERTTAEIIVYSTFPPNPQWKFGSHRMAEYAAATERAARATSCAYADVFNNWQTLAARKKPEDLLGNNINHPNDFGHWIYYRVLSGVGL